MDDAQFITFLIGKRVKLTLKNALNTSSYVGVVLRINPNKTLVLGNVIDSNGGKQGTKMFSGREILNIEFANDENADRKNTLDSSEEKLAVENYQPYRKFMNLDDDDEDDEESINFVVVDDIQEKFGPAMMHIKKQSVIGVGCEGVGIFENGRLCWLQIATKNKVYLFDILLLGRQAFKNGLSMILESKQILKVIHDCRAVVGSLIGQFGVKLNNVFDTQVADVMCFYSKTGGFLPDRVSTLPEVVNLYLNVPSSRLSSLRVRSQLTKEEMEMWYMRPCPVLLLKVMALSVIHLKPLRLVLLDTLMTDYMVLVDLYLNSSLYEPDGLEHLTMENVLELPKELRQLDTMQRERQEWACKHYPITDQGLLARFNPYPQSEATPPAEYSGSQSDSSEAGAPAPHPSPEMDPPDVQQTQRCSSVISTSSLLASSNLPASLFSPQKETSTSPLLTAGVNNQCNQLLVDVMGRGRQLGKDQSSVPVFLSNGRGFLLQKPQAQIPGERAGGVTSPVKRGTSLEAPGYKLPKPANRGDERPKNTYGMAVHPAPANPSIPSLIKSFRSFRN